MQAVVGRREEHVRGPKSWPSSADRGGRARPEDATGRRVLKCIVLGGYAGSAELSDWARHERDGYNTREVPSYRRVAAPLLADGFQGRWQFERRQISVHDLPDFARNNLADDVALPMGIGQIETAAQKSKPTGIQPPGLDMLASFMNQSGEYSISVSRLYYDISPLAFAGVRDNVRTKLVAMVAELRRQGVTAAEVPSTEVTDRAFQVIINGAKRSPITVTHANVTGEGASTTVITNPPHPNNQLVPAWIRGPWGVLIGLATLGASYAAFAPAFGWPPF